MAERSSTKLAKETLSRSHLIRVNFYWIALSRKSYTLWYVWYDKAVQRTGPCFLPKQHTLDTSDMSKLFLQACGYRVLPTQPLHLLSTDCFLHCPFHVSSFIAYNPACLSFEANAPSSPAPSFVHFVIVFPVLPLVLCCHCGTCTLPAVLGKGAVYHSVVQLGRLCASQMMH